MNSFTFANAGVPVSRAVAALLASRKFPLRVTCLGEIEYPEDDPIYGSYSTVTTIELAQCGSLDEAIAFVEGIARQSRIVTGDDDAIGFQPALHAVAHHLPYAI